MYAFIREKLADEWATGDTEEQFIYKTRKKVWGPFKQQVWTLPEDTRAAIRAQLEEKLDFLYKQLGVFDSQALVAKYIPNPNASPSPSQRPSKPSPPEEHPLTRASRGLSQRERLYPSGHEV